MTRSVDLTVWVILEVLKIIYARRYGEGKVRTYAGTKSFQVHRYAVQKKDTCVSTQIRRSSGAPVRSVEEGYLRQHADQKKLRCVRIVKARGAIRFKVAFHQLRYAAR